MPRDLSTKNVTKNVIKILPAADSQQSLHCSGYTYPACSRNCTCKYKYKYKCTKYRY